MKRDKAVLEFVTVSANRTVLFENDNKKGTWQDFGCGLIKINIDGKTLASEVLNCGLKLRFTSPSSYKASSWSPNITKSHPLGTSFNTHSRGTTKLNVKRMQSSAGAPSKSILKTYWRPVKKTGTNGVRLPAKIKLTGHRLSLPKLEPSANSDSSLLTTKPVETRLVWKHTFCSPRINGCFAKLFSCNSAANAFLQSKRPWNRLTEQTGFCYS